MSPTTCPSRVHVSVSPVYRERLGLSRLWQSPRVPPLEGRAAVRPLLHRAYRQLGKYSEILRKRRPRARSAVMNILVHHLQYSRSIRALWMLEELGLDYEIKHYKRNPKTFRAPPELTQAHPLGRAPVVELDGLVLAESGAILEHLAERFPDAGLRPTEPEAFQRFRFFLHYAEGSVMPPLLMKLITGKLRTSPMPFFIKPIAKSIAGKIDDNYAGPEAKRHAAFIESELASRTYFCGDAFTAADIQMSYPVSAALSRGVGGLPNTQVWLDRVTARPAYIRAVEKGGPPHLPS
ncbi:MAG: glutathione S-transferase [Myxococcota bacterium]|jgi:glutathione S-transferase